MMMIKKKEKDIDIDNGWIYSNPEIGNKVKYVRQELKWLRGEKQY